MRGFKILFISLFFAVFIGVVGQIESESDLPACGQICVNNMLALGASLGCTSADTACLCQNANFRYGVRDCSNEACGAEVASTVIGFANMFCSAASGTTQATAGNDSSSTSTLSSVQTSAAAPSQSSTSAVPSKIISSFSSSPTSKQTTSPTFKASDGAQSLSTGAKVGIGIGVVIGVAIICLLVYIVFLLRRQHRARPGPVQEDSRLPELGPGLTPEMDGRSKPTELPTKRDNNEKALKTRSSELQG